MSNAIISDGKEKKKDKVLEIDPESIDYYFILDNKHEVGETVIMCFRFQIFVTRSKVVLLENIKNKCKIVGTYDSLGRKIDE